MKISSLLLLVLCVILCTGLVSAVSFDNEVISGDMLTSMNWEFDSPWNSEKDVYNEYLDLYVDNIACKDVSIKMFALTPVTYDETVCSTINDCTVEKQTVNDNKTGLPTTIDVNVCTPKKTCKNVTKTVIDKIDLEKSDYLLGQNDRIRVEATKKASTGFSSCDLNFKYDDNTASLDNFDTKTYNKLWWNNSWSKSVKFNVTAPVYQVYRPFQVEFNTSIVSYCTISDVRIVNGTGDGAVVFNISLINSTHIFLFINDTLSTSKNYSLYCDNPNATSVSTAISELELNKSAIAYYKLDTVTSFLAPDSFNNYPGTLMNESFTPTVVVNNFGLYSDKNNVANQNIFSMTHPKGVTNFCYSSWLKTSDATRTSWLLTDRQDAGNQVDFAFYVNNDKLYWESNATPYITFTPGDNVLVNIIANRFSNGTVAFYFNGTFAGTVSTDGADDYGDSWKMFSYTYSGTSYAGFYSVLDEVYLKNSTCSDADIIALYNSGNSTSYPFYGSPVVSVGSLESTTSFTNLDSGLMVGGIIRSNLSVSSGEVFVLWNNWSYSTNGTKISSSDGFCNYSVFNMSDVLTIGNSSWDSVSELWKTPSLVEYSSGEYNASFDCYFTGGGVLNATDTLSFNVTGVVPISGWVNSSTAIFGYLPSFAYSCYDPEFTNTSGLIGYVLLNGTTMVTNFPIANNASVGYSTAGYVEGVHNLSIICGDGFYNSTASSFLFTYVSACVNNITGIVDNARYRDNTLMVSFGCTNSVTLTSCNVFINKFASESLVCNASNNLTLEIGRNEVIFELTGNGVATNSTYVVYAKKLNESGVAGYAIIIILVLVLAALFMAYTSFLQMGSVAVLISIGGCVLGASLLAFSFWAGGFVIMASIIFALYEVMK